MCPSATLGIYPRYEFLRTQEKIRLDRLHRPVKSFGVSVGRLKTLSRLYELAAASPHVAHTCLGMVADLEFPRFIFKGPRGGGDSVRFGLFAGIHGDEPAGVVALVRLMERLVQQPDLAQGYRLFAYPSCNPTGLMARSRLSRAGKDLNREFWKDSAEPEVRLLEQEIRSEDFHGLISLHTDDTSPGMYGFVRGAVLSKALLEPALRAAEAVVPRNNATVIDGFPAHHGIISQCYEGILTSPPELMHEPFEIILETPASAAEEEQIEALVRALSAILSSYQQFLAFAANL
jgi:protein MpaA